MKKINFSQLFLFILAPLGAGFVGSFFTSQSVNSWYTTLNKPKLNPPGWIFAPVWTMLYILMGIASYKVFKNGTGNAKKQALIFYGVQLLFNLLWSILFFGLQRPDLSLLEIVVLWLLIVATLVKFYRIDKWAGYLLIPYLLWVSFASFLNLQIYMLNR